MGILRGFIDRIVNASLALISSGLTPSDFHFLNQNVLAGAILFFWNQYSNIVRTKLSSTALTVRVIIKKLTFYES